VQSVRTTFWLISDPLLRQSTGFILKAQLLFDKNFSKNYAFEWQMKKAMLKQDLKNLA
jgi:hypothetical protein